MKGRLEVFEGRDGLWYFRVQAANGKIVAQSEGYTRRRNCVKGLEVLKNFDFSQAIIFIE